MISTVKQAPCFLVSLSFTTAALREDLRALDSCSITTSRYISFLSSFPSMRYSSNRFCWSISHHRLAPPTGTRSERMKQTLSADSLRTQVLTLRERVVTVSMGGVGEECGGERERKRRVTVYTVKEQNLLASCVIQVISNSLALKRILTLGFRGEPLHLAAQGTVDSHQLPAKKGGYFRNTCFAVVVYGKFPDIAAGVCSLTPLLLLLPFCSAYFLFHSLPLHPSFWWLMCRTPSSTLSPSNSQWLQQFSSTIATTDCKYICTWIHNSISQLSFLSCSFSVCVSLSISLCL